jgi:hypothetical protein
MEFNDIVIVGLMKYMNGAGHRMLSEMLAQCKSINARNN